MHIRRNMTDGEYLLRKALNHLINSRSNSNGMFAGTEDEWNAYVDACGILGGLFPTI